VFVTYADGTTVERAARDFRATSKQRAGSAERRWARRDQRRAAYLDLIRGSVRAAYVINMETADAVCRRYGITRRELMQLSAP
jgi:hypothetical protein